MLCDINYTELVFKLKFTEDAVLPIHKVSMLNGALLNILLSLYCINNRKCNDCDIVNRCLIQKLLGGKFDADKPLILQNQNLYPSFLIDCDNKAKRFRQDQELIFNVRLLNEAVDYISQFIYAFDQIGSIGIGKNRSKYSLIGIYNNQNRPVFENGILHEGNILSESIADFISRKKRSLVGAVALFFTSPFGMEQTSLGSYFHNLLNSIKNRLYNLGALEEKDLEILDTLDGQQYITNFKLKIIKRNYQIEKIGQSKTVTGVEGKISLSQQTCSLIDYLIACEKLCIGSHIILGNGRFTVKGEGQNASGF